MSWSPSRWLVFAALASVAVATILWLGRAHTFTGDETDFLQRELNLPDLLRPHNEHLSALPVLAYRVLIALFGTGSYLPFLALLVALHVSAAAAVTALIGGRVGLAAGAVMLFLGSGYENLFWAFQIGLVGSVAAGLWAMKVRQPWASAALVLASLAASGMGLAFILPVALLRGRGALWLAIPISAYAAWYLVFGQPPEHAGALSQTVTWVAVGIGWAFGSLFGVGLAVGLGLAAATAYLAPSGDRLCRAALAGLLVEYLLIALSRSAMEFSSFAGAPRYVYVAAPFLLISLAGSIRDRRLLGVLYAVALVVNVYALPAGAAAW